MTRDELLKDQDQTWTALAQVVAEMIRTGTLTPPEFHKLISHLEWLKAELEKVETA